MINMFDKQSHNEKDNAASNCQWSQIKPSARAVVWSGALKGLGQMRSLKHSNTFGIPEDEERLYVCGDESAEERRNTFTIYTHFECSNKWSWPDHRSSVLNVEFIYFHICSL